MKLIHYLSDNLPKLLIVVVFIYVKLTTSGTSILSK